jgi:hypothetical protein
MTTAVEPCLKKALLLRVRADLVRQYFATAREALLQAHTSDLAAYNRLLRTAEVARVRCEEAEVDYRQHVAQHGC